MSRRTHRYLRRSAGVSRRDFLIRAGLISGGVLLTPSLLAACGDDGGDEKSSGGGGGGGDAIKISNWTSYVGEDSVKDFEKATGIKVDYIEDINDNNEYFAKVQPQLSEGRSIDRDAFVLTDWMASRMIQLEWVQELDADAFPNKDNLRAELRSPTFDEDRTYTAPWASGMTGIAYNLDATGGKEIKTIDDFLAASGAKTVLSEMRDTMELFMLADGKDPANPTFADAEPSFDRLEKAFEDGSITGVNGNEYVADLGAGNLAACFAWSGDVAQITLENPKIKFAIPESGGTLWSDNFMIPATSKKAKLATEWIDYFYDPVNAAALTAVIQYVSPVDGVAEELTKMGGEAAALVDNPLVVPTDEFLQKLVIFGPLDEKEEQQFDERFAEITGAG